MSSKKIVGATALLLVAGVAFYANLNRPPTAVTATLVEESIPSPISSTNPVRKVDAPARSNEALSELLRKLAERENEVLDPRMKGHFPVTTLHCDEKYLDINNDGVAQKVRICKSTDTTDDGIDYKAMTEAELVNLVNSNNVWAMIELGARTYRKDSELGERYLLKASAVAGDFGGIERLISYYDMSNQKGLENLYVYKSLEREMLPGSAHLKRRVDGIVEDLESYFENDQVGLKNLLVRLDAKIEERKKRMQDFRAERIDGGEMSLFPLPPLKSKEGES